MNDKYQSDLENVAADTTKATTKIKVLEARAFLKKATEGTTVIHRYQPTRPRIGWAQRTIKLIRHLF
jgi:hypothetical protein